MPPGDSVIAGRHCIYIYIYFFVYYRFSILVRCLSVLNVHFCKKSPKLAQMTFDRYLSNPDIGRTFWDVLTHSNWHKSKMATGKIGIVVYVLASWSWYLNYDIQGCRVGI